MEESIVVAEQSQGENSIMADLASRMTQMLNQNQNQTQSPSYEPAVQIGIKLNGTNYALQSQVVNVYLRQRQVGIYKWGVSTAPRDRPWLQEVED